MYDDKLLRRLALLENMSVARRLVEQVPRHEKDPFAWAALRLLQRFLTVAALAVWEGSEAMFFYRRPGDQVMVLRSEPLSTLPGGYILSREKRHLDDWCLDSIFHLIDEGAIPFEKEDFAWMV